MKTASLVIFNEDYTDDQKGYLAAKKDGAVHLVDIDEESYTALYNVQQSIEATCKCLDQYVAVGVVQGNRYIPLNTIENTVLTPDLDYETLAGAFDIGVKHEAILNTKELTVAEIEKLLGHNVKIIKE